MKKLNIDHKLFLLLFGIMLTSFVFSNSAHRFSFDEDLAQKQTSYLVTGKPGSLYVQGNSTMLYEYPSYFPQRLLHNVPACKNAILCSPINIGWAVTEVPFVLINHYFHFITKDTVMWDAGDFDDPAYVYWRNSIDPDFTFLQLLYGPLFSSLAVGSFFLICRSFNFNQRTSITLALVYGFSTLLWAYSKTSFGTVPMVFFTLLGFLFFRKFQENNSKINLIICGASLGFGFLVRQDVVLIIIPLFFFLLYSLRKQTTKILKFLSFVVPVAISYFVYLEINVLRYASSPVSQASSVPSSVLPSSAPSYQFLVGLFGIFLSPGVGLFIFVPILFTVFFSFSDFYKRNKPECLLILSFSMLFVLFYGNNGGGWWHGLVAWGSRYLVPIIPFLLLPLGASIEKRKNKILKSFLFILVGFGFFFNIVYVTQDVSWFVWGNAGLHTGLFGIEKNGLYDLNIHPATLWTFEFSQLTQSIMTAFTHLQPDIFLLKILGVLPFGVVLAVILGVLVYLLVHSLRNIKKTSYKIS